MKLLWIYLLIQFIPIAGCIVAIEFWDWWEKTTNQNYSLGHLLLIVLFLPYVLLILLFWVLYKIFKLLLNVKIIKRKTLGTERR